MRQVFNKPVKMLILTLMSLIVVAASAAVYYSLVMQSTVTTAGAIVTFVDGSDSSAAGATGHATDGTWVNLAGLEAYPNATLTYDEAINITNSDASAHQFRLRHSSIVNNTATSNFTSIVFKLIAPNGTQYGGDFTYDNTDGNDIWTTPSTMSYLGIDAGEEWAVKVETLAASGATAAVTTNIVIYIDVQ